MRPGLSLGVASRGPGTMTSSELLRQADLAMYAAKEAGKNCYVHFRPEMLAALLERTQLTAGLRRAVELGQINVHYQPVVSTEQLEVVQFEALARWQWEGKLMPPDQFIQTAERSGLIRDIGAEVLRRSCTELQPWLAEDPRRTLAVNVSGVQLQHPDFAERVLDIAAWSGVDPHQLVLEVTESVFFDAQCHVITQLVTLRGAGIRVALDDFGTGYSSLGRLQELPVDIVKIDKSFVSMLRSGTEKLPILTSMIHMARSLGPEGHGRGHRNPGAGPLPDGSRLRRPAGLPLLPPRARVPAGARHPQLRRGHRGAGRCSAARVGGCQAGRRAGSGPLRGRRRGRLRGRRRRHNSGRGMTRITCSARTTYDSVSAARLVLRKVGCHFASVAWGAGKTHGIWTRTSTAGAQPGPAAAAGSGRVHLVPERGR